ASCALIQHSRRLIAELSRSRRYWCPRRRSFDNRDPDKGRPTMTANPTCDVTDGMTASGQIATWSSRLTNGLLGPFQSLKHPALSRYRHKQKAPRETAEGFSCFEKQL
ncbi:MAG TPA: hypothetical protein VFV70_14915, partial [Hyphomonadaceae bacterium]|nr:hypothetical protein [Hyphomonadaceae bacterium]